MNKYVQMALGLASLIDINNEQWKQRIREEWRQSIHLPRKKKKAKRKDLLIQWSLAKSLCYDPFDIKL